jgi:hypothetical protein
LTETEHIVGDRHLRFGDRHVARQALGAKRATLLWLTVGGTSDA